MKRIVVVYPELLGTYGDGGNARVLFERARRRGIALDVTMASIDDALPIGDLYLLGGGEDGPQRLAADRLRNESLASRVSDGALVFAVCAGLQLLGTEFSVEGNAAYPGLGLVDAQSRRGSQRRVGDLAVSVGDNILVGFENHGGDTVLGAGLSPLGRVRYGYGNNGAVDGFRTPQIIATYAHGPVLAQNPWLADEVLSALLDEPLAPLTMVADQLHLDRRTALGC